MEVDRYNGQFLSNLLQGNPENASEIDIYPYLNCLTRRLLGVHRSKLFYRKALQMQENLLVLKFEHRSIIYSD